MATYDFDLGIIGGGAAGLTAAAGAAQLGAKTLIIEKEPALGGDCLHYGCVPSKTLIHTARVRHLMATAERFGLPPAPLEPVDFRQVAARIRQVIATIQQHDSVERFCRLGALVRFGAPEFVDDHAVRLDGDTISARAWLIATGSSPAIPKIPGLDRTPFLTNREIFSLDRLPASLVILGAGPIAIEMAQAFCRLGSRVTVVQRSGQILSKEDPDLAGTVQERLAAEGISFLLETRVEEVADLGDRRRVVVRDRDGTQHQLEAEAILVALGRVPNVAGLGLDKAGVQVERRGIPVNSRMRTNQSHIYAAGDVTGTYQFTHVAGYQGGIVVANAVMRLPRRASYRWVPWCTYSDPELASVGLNEKRAREQGLEYTVWREPFTANDRAVAEDETSGVVKLVLDHREKPLGVQILGPRAGDLLAEWMAVLAGNVGLARLAGAIHPYPTLGEINKRVAGDVLAPKIFSPLVKKGLQFLFSLKGRACFPGETDRTIET